MSVGKWFAANTAQGIYQALIAVIVVGGGAALFTWLKGLPLHWAILLGVATALGLALAADVVSRIITRHRPPHQPLAETPSQCPDTWLHDLAEEQAKAIQFWVNTDVAYGRRDLLRKHPYIEFWLTLHNTSVFNVSLTGLGARSSLQINRLVERLNGEIPR
jgi:hypothetical protein